MNRTIRLWLSFSVTTIASAFVAWCCGYDFDYRAPEVGTWVAYTLVSAALVAGSLECYYE